MPTVAANGINIEYEIQGAGPPLVLIAGLGYDRWMWHKMVSNLAENFRVITYDNRGVGGSDKPPGPYTAQLLAADLAALLDCLQIERAHIAGHSMGGFVAQALAIDYPQRVDRLVLSATNFGGPHHIPVTQEALGVLTDTSSPPLERLRRGILISCAAGFAVRQPQLIDEWIAYRAANPIDLTGYQAQMGIGLALMSPAAAFESKLGAVKARTLLLSGDEDKVVPPANIDLLAAVLPRAEKAIIEGAGHFFPLEKPETAVRLITRFLQE